MLTSMLTIFDFFLDSRSETTNSPRKIVMCCIKYNIFNNNSNLNFLKINDQ